MKTKGYEKMKVRSKIIIGFFTVCCSFSAVDILAQQHSATEAFDVAITHLDEQRLAIGLQRNDYLNAEITDHHVSKKSGITHLYLRQSHGGLDVVNGTMTVNIGSNGEVIGLGNAFKTGLESAALNARPVSLSAEQAIEKAAEQLNLDVSEPLQQLSNKAGVSQASVYSGAGISKQDIPIHLAYYITTNDELIKVWDLQIVTLDGQHYWHLWIDAETGELQGKADWISQDTYEVYELPREHPNEDDDPLNDDRTLQIDPATAVASPFGWHDTNGSAGAEYTDTRGNNVYAQEDRNANNSGGFRPDGGPGLDFQSPLDLSQEPPVYESASITNLFYWNNILHDVLYEYGFDEAAGNFQENNYGNGGAGSDPVQADAQDGSGTNNANFATPPDGSSAVRMQMYEWTDPFPNELVVNSPASIAGSYIAGAAVFGPAAGFPGLTADLILVDDGAGAPTEGCNALINGAAISGNLALVDRGSCAFTVKVKNAENAGAIGVVVANNASTGIVTMGGTVTGPPIQIPSGMISLVDGDLIKTQLVAGVNATFRNDGGNDPNRDSALDNGVIAHEYCHGLSNRLTGGPANSSCLSGNQQAGEGWSDFCSLFITAKADDLDITPRGIGTYLNFEPRDGNGIRVYRYSSDLVVNPFKYSDINSGISVPHGVGTVWATALWDMYWQLVSQYGFDSDFYNGTGGNNLAMQLVVDGLKAQPCNPTFLDARDAILSVAASNGVDECLIWEAFAKRGMGSGAIAGVDDGGSSSSLNVTDSFTVPLSCTNLCLDTRRVSNREISVTETHRGVTSVTLGTNLTVTPNGDVSVFAGNSVSFEGPVSIDGVLTVTITPTPCVP